MSEVKVIRGELDCLLWEPRQGTSVSSYVGLPVFQVHRQVGELSDPGSGGARTKPPLNVACEDCEVRSHCIRHILRTKVVRHVEFKNRYNQCSNT